MCIKSSKYIKKDIASLEKKRKKTSLWEKEKLSINTMKSDCSQYEERNSGAFRRGYSRDKTRGILYSAMMTRNRKLRR